MFSLGLSKFRELFSRQETINGLHIPKRVIIAIEDSDLRTLNRYTRFFIFELFYQLAMIGVEEVYFTELTASTSSDGFSENALESAIAYVQQFRPTFSVIHTNIENIDFSLFNEDETFTDDDVSTTPIILLTNRGRAENRAAGFEFPSSKACYFNAQTEGMNKVFIDIGFQYFGRSYTPWELVLDMRRNAESYQLIPFLEDPRWLPETIPGTNSSTKEGKLLSIATCALAVNLIAKPFVLQNTPTTSKVIFTRDYMEQAAVNAFNALGIFPSKPRTGGAQSDEIS